MVTEGVLSAVKKIVDVYVADNGERYFRINWRDTWEIEENLINCDELLEIFWENRKSIQKIKCGDEPKHVEEVPSTGKVENLKENIPSEEFDASVSDSVHLQFNHLIERSASPLQCPYCKVSNCYKLETADCASQCDNIYKNKSFQYDFVETKEVSAQVSTSTADCGIQSLIVSHNTYGNFIETKEISSQASTETVDRSVQIGVLSNNQYCQCEDIIFKKEVCVQFNPDTADLGVQKSLCCKDAFSQCNENSFQMEIACQFNPETISCGTQICVSYEDKETQYEHFFADTSNDSNQCPTLPIDQQYSELLSNQALIFDPSDVYLNHQNVALPYLKNENMVKEMLLYTQSPVDVFPESTKDKNEDVEKPENGSLAGSAPRFLQNEEKTILNSQVSNICAASSVSNHLFQTLNEGMPAYPLEDEKIVCPPDDVLSLNHTPVSLSTVLTNTPLSAKRKERSRRSSANLSIDSIFQDSSSLRKGLKASESGKKHRAPRRIPRCKIASTPVAETSSPSSGISGCALFRENNPFSEIKRSNANSVDISVNGDNNELLVSDPTAITCNTLKTPDLAAVKLKKRKCSNGRRDDGSIERRKFKVSKSKVEGNIETLKSEFDVDSLYASPVYDPIHSSKIANTLEPAASFVKDEQKIEMFSEDIPVVHDNSCAETSEEIISDVKSINEDFICKYWK